MVHGSLSLWILYNSPTLQRMPSQSIRSIHWDDKFFSMLLYFREFAYNDYVHCSTKLLPYLLLRKREEGTRALLCVRGGSWCAGSLSAQHKKKGEGDLPLCSSKMVFFYYTQSSTCSRRSSGLSHSLRVLYSLFSVLTLRVLFLLLTFFLSLLLLPKS